MPNWCSNHATIRHKDPTKIKRLSDAYTRGATCQEFIPEPEGVDWYSWRSAHWGVKWDFGQGDHGHPPAAIAGGVKLYFDSPWSPPFGFYLELIREGFEVDAKFWEPGAALCGRVLGTVIKTFGIKSEDISQIRKNIDADIVEAFGMDDFYEIEEDDEPEEDEITDEPWVEEEDLASLVARQHSLRSDPVCFEFERNADGDGCDESQFLEQVEVEAAGLLAAAETILNFIDVFEDTEVTYDDDGVACLHVTFSLPHPDDDEPKPDESWTAAVYEAEAEVWHLRNRPDGLTIIVARERMPLDEFVEVLWRVREKARQ